MNIYRQIVEKEKNEKEKSENNIPSIASTSSSTGSTGNDKNESHSKDDDMIRELKDENKRLKRLVKKYEKESKSIIDRSLIFRDNEKTAVMQTLELFRFNNYLISCLPEPKRILSNYLKNSNKTIDKNNNKSVETNDKIEDTIEMTETKDEKIDVKIDANVENLTEDCNEIRILSENGVHSDDDRDSDQSGDKNSGNDSEIHEPKGRKRSVKRRSLRKMGKNAEIPERYPKRRREKLDDLKRDTTDEENDDKVDDTNTGTKTPTPKRTPRKSTKSPEKPTAPTSTSSKKPKRLADLTANQSSDNSNTDSTKPTIVENKSKTKRKRIRVEEQTGYFPCTYDTTQCNEIMDTKEHFEFHMSGHYDAQYVCPFCAYTGPTVQVIKRHITTERESTENVEDLDLSSDKKAHKYIKIYQCLGCKVCDKIHEKDEKKCEHIIEDEENLCEFGHDIDYEFKDHLKRHFNETIKIKDKELKREKVKAIIEKFVSEQYFENNAKKRLLVKKFSKTNTKDKTNEKKTTENDTDSDDWD